jgi:hypothetical protein
MRLSSPPTLIFERGELGRFRGTEPSYRSDLPSFPSAWGYAGCPQTQYPCGLPSLPNLPNLPRPKIDFIEQDAVHGPAVCASGDLCADCRQPDQPALTGIAYRHRRCPPQPRTAPQSDSFEPEPDPATPMRLSGSTVDHHEVDGNNRESLCKPMTTRKSVTNVMSAGFTHPFRGRHILGDYVQRAFRLKQAFDDLLTAIA